MRGGALGGWEGGDTASGSRERTAGQALGRAPAGLGGRCGEQVGRVVRPARRLTAAPPQEIDGKALLLLRSDMMMKYMGLKLGTAVKLCHYIDKLKGEKFFDN